VEDSSDLLLSEENLSELPLSIEDFLAPLFVEDVPELASSWEELSDLPLYVEDSSRHASSWEDLLDLALFAEDFSDLPPFAVDLSDPMALVEDFSDMPFFAMPSLQRSASLVEAPDCWGWFLPLSHRPRR